MDVSESQEVRQLREENARLKQLVADLSLDKDTLQSVIRKDSLARRETGESAAAESRICDPRVTRLRADGVLRQHLTELAHEKPRFGYR
jgi:hypothetical protein